MYLMCLNVLAYVDVIMYNVKVEKYGYMLGMHVHMFDVCIIGCCTRCT